MCINNVLNAFENKTKNKQKAKHSISDTVYSNQ